MGTIGGRHRPDQRLGRHRIAHSDVIGKFVIEL